MSTDHVQPVGHRFVTSSLAIFHMFQSCSLACLFVTWICISGKPSLSAAWNMSVIRPWVVGKLAKEIGV